MALTLTPTRFPGFEQPERIGRLMCLSVEVALASTYVTGGHAYTAADLGLPSGSSVLRLEFPYLFRNGTNAVVPTWDRSNKKIMFFQSTTGAPNPLIEVANGTSLASYSGPVKVFYLE